MDEQATQYGNKLLIDLVYKIIPFQEIHYQLSNQGGVKSSIFIRNI